MSAPPGGVYDKRMDRIFDFAGVYRRRIIGNDMGVMGDEKESREKIKG